jgi:hypothetical protein
VTFQRNSHDSDPSPLAASRTASASSAVAAAEPGQAPVAIQRLTYRPAAEVWPEGAAPLVRWLRANPDVVGDLLGTQLSETADDLPASDACVFEDTASHRVLVVVELGESSEATFGGLMTRLSATRAQAAVWICGSARPEHTAAVSWLNRSVDARFYIARLRAARIGSSPAAPHLDLTVRPPRASDARSNAPSGSPERGRRAEDWREISLGEPDA